MPDIAELGIRVDASGAVRDLGRLDDAAGRVGKSASGVSAVFGAMPAPLKAAAGAMIAFVAAGAGFSVMVQGAKAFNLAIAETSTLLPVGSKEVGILSQKANELALQFGTTRTEQAKGFYQAISAGASGAAEALEIMTTANKLAIGGLTKSTVGVDALTTILNAYGRANITAAQASDAMFVGMKAGKTTIDELANGLGNIIPIAAAMKVNFDSLVSSVAALTLQGLTTSDAITGMRAILTAVAKPAEDAAKKANKLGLDFTAAALASKGLAGFLTDVINKAEGNVDSLALLFGSVEALNAVLAFGGGAGAKFTEILDQMKVKAGQTNEAYTKISESLSGRMDRAIQNMSTKFEQFGDKLLTVVVPALEKTNALMDATPGAFDKASASAERYGRIVADVVMPIIRGLGNFIKPTIDSITDLWMGLGKTMSDSLTGNESDIRVFANSVVKTFASMSEIIGFEIGNVSDKLAGFLLNNANAIQRVQTNTEELQKRLTAISTTDYFRTVSTGATTTAVNMDVAAAATQRLAVATAAIAKMPPKFSAETQKHLDDLQFEIEQVGRSERAQAIYNEVQQEGVLIGSAAGIAIAEKAGRLFDLTKAAEAATDQAKAFNDVVNGILDDEVTDRINRAAKATDDFNKIIETTLEDEAKLIQDKATLKTSLENEVIANEQLIAALQVSEAEYGRLSKIMSVQNDMKAKGILLSEGEQIAIDDTVDKIAGQEKVVDSLKDRYETMKRLGSDMGMAFSSAFEDGIVKGKQFSQVLAGLAEDIIRLIVRTTITAPLASAASSVFANIGTSLFASAKGNVFDQGSHVTAYAKGGVVNGPTVFPMANGAGLMGEAGPEAVMPLRRGRGGRLGVESSNDNGGTVVNIYGGQNNKIETQRRQTEGGTTIDVFIDEAVARNVANRSSRTNKTLRNTNTMVTR